MTRDLSDIEKRYAETVGEIEILEQLVVKLLLSSIVNGDMSSLSIKEEFARIVAENAENGEDAFNQSKTNGARSAAHRISDTIETSERFAKLVGGHAKRGA